MRVKQGNTYDIELALTFEDGTPVTDENAAVVELTLGRKFKTWPGDVTFDGELWVYPLSQQETLKMSGTPTLKARVKDLAGEVSDCDVAIVVVGKSNSKEVL